MTKEILVRYVHDSMTRFEMTDIGDWCDLRASETVKLEKGEFGLIPLGVAMKLPDGYEAHVAPRSSTFKNFGVIQTNGIGIIDNSYQGNDDLWFMPVFALRDTEICENDRVCQFRIVKKQPKLGFVEVNKLDGKNRGGHGSTGVQ